MFILKLATKKEFKDKKTPVLIYNHGGGFVWGDWNSKKRNCLCLCERGVRVLYLEYFLCPEYRSPYQYDNMNQCLDVCCSEA